MSSQQSPPGMAAVQVWEETLVIPTYEPAEPDRNPMFLDKRVYQGSSGRVYPLPFVDRIAFAKTERKWRAIWLENEFLKVMILPETGGRVHRAIDKTNGYDFIYYQPVIKPALVGLAGPWISGGIEFNWPQHHRPATFMPVDVAIEEHEDGSRTVWLGDRDPMTRMKGMHGICLYPDKALLELKVRVYNPTPFVQTFLWWANVATRVHEGYQSFFPPDVGYVADHAKRATSEYPLCSGLYYGVDYGTRGSTGVPPDEIPSRFIPPHCRKSAEEKQSPLPDYAPNDLSWYANIPTPCSYMCMGSGYDFFGGYDHFKQAGIVHVADHRIAPGKKQWTWGNHEFGYAWDRNLSDDAGPYIELMAGVYTDNQPDFSFLDPGETKTWRQVWYPIQRIGVPKQANENLAVTMAGEEGVLHIGISAAARFEQVLIAVLKGSERIAEYTVSLAPGTPFWRELPMPKATRIEELTLRVDELLPSEVAGRELISYAPKPGPEGEVPAAAVEPPPPEAIATIEELYLTGLHLEQYCHATRRPTVYWLEALRRDPLDSRCNNALGLWRLKRGELREAEEYFRKAIRRLTELNPNPRDGEPYYNLGLCLFYRLELETASDSDLWEEAYDSFSKACWNGAWRSAGHLGLALLDCRRGSWPRALDHLERSLAADSHNSRARNLMALVLTRLHRMSEAQVLISETVARDPLDWWARHLLACEVPNDAQTALDLALEYAKGGFFSEALDLLEAFLNSGKRGGDSDPDAGSRSDPRDLGTAPLLHYYMGWLEERLASCGEQGDTAAALRHYRLAAKQAPDYCFPSRLEEIAILSDALRANPGDGRALFYLGNLFYDRERCEEAIEAWESAVALEPGNSVALRNLGIAHFNVRKDVEKARSAYDQAVAAARPDARVLYERDQLWKRTGESPARRLAELESHLDLVHTRDDLSIELCTLYNQTGRHEEALRVLSTRHFQPWEGGEGLALGQHVRTHLDLGRTAWAEGDAATARRHFQAALESPSNLGEAKHLLANQSDVHYWLGVACDALGEEELARRHWTTAAKSRGDFQDMTVRSYSEMTYFSALSWTCLGRPEKGAELLEDLLSYALELADSPARIDYFATSLPNMLLFDDDIQLRQETTALFLQAQAHLGLGRVDEAIGLLGEVLKRDPNHALAADLLEEMEETFQ